MTVDASALVAVVLGELGCEDYEQQLQRAPILHISSVTLYETATVLLRRRGREALSLLWAVVEVTGIQVVEFDATQMMAAIKPMPRMEKASIRSD